MTLTDAALVAALVLLLAVLPGEMDKFTGYQRMEHVDCSKPLSVGEHRLRVVRADGRTKLQCVRV